MFAGELRALRSLVDALPATPENIGHNRPPESIGHPPYYDEDRKVLLHTVNFLASAMGEGELTKAQAEAAVTPLRSVKDRLGDWLLSKGDVLVDETIKTVVKLGAPTIIILYTDLTSKLGRIIELLIEIVKHL